MEHIFSLEFLKKLSEQLKIGKSKDYPSKLLLTS